MELNRNKYLGLPKEKLRELYAFHAGIVATLERQIAQSQSELDKIAAFLGGHPEIPIAPQSIEHLSGGYNPAATWLEKFEYVIKQAGMPLPVRAVRGWVNMYEPGAYSDERTRKFLDGRLSALYKQERIGRMYVPGKKGGFYYPLDWVGENGELRKEFEMKIG
jgi:hypothetical protein